MQAYFFMYTPINTARKSFVGLTARPRVFPETKNGAFFKACSGKLAAQDETSPAKKQDDQ